MRTKEEIINNMMDEMPFDLSENIKPYILEAMEIYAKEVISNNVIHDVSDTFTANDVQRAYYDGLNDNSDLFNIKNYR